ncbi:hypothetical protein CW751_03425 [Brumimicrobium salinarum]|uniref:Organic solvent tolerance-like N-terminal domain-containing protein n=1 Tax=Brumimicrobium salinarum TaxID=2058658 RepID=A0A2I0R4U8_9FLAO|nr:OstA-like protein [Brumimicrobium salinarum]PKR81588.1 hypothetical protein CW751_03425 [Brumimicrobium salinarum]
MNILKIALFVGGAIFLFPKNALNQEFIELIEGSDELRLDGKTGNYIVKGNVIFKKENTQLYCDSAYFNIVNNTIRAYGNIHLNKQDTLNMFCDSLFFDTKKEYAKLYGNVRVRDNEYKLTTDSLDYDIKKNVGIYKNKGEITSIKSNDQLNSVIGYFYPESKQFNFRNEVVYKNDEFTVTTDTLQFNGLSKKAFFFGPTHIMNAESNMYCEKGWYNLNENVGVLEQNAFIDRNELFIAADSLYYSAIDSIYIGKYNVNILDTTNKVGFNGDYAINDESKNFSFITGHALAKRFDDEDTLYIHADTLYNYLDTTRAPKLLQAFNGVKIFRGDMQGVCDSLTYDRKLGEMNMYKAPTLWAKKAQLSGDTISIYEENNEIQRAFLRKNGLVITHVDSTNYYNQVAGTSMNALFDSTAIRRVNIEGNAKTIYFLEEENENDTVIIVERKGMNRIYASNISLGFSAGEIETATYRESPDGMLYPMNDIKKEEERVEQFKWSIDNRPLSWQDMIYSPEEKETIISIYRNLSYFKNIVFEQL